MRRCTQFLTRLVGNLRRYVFYHSLIVPVRHLDAVDAVVRREDCLRSHRLESQAICQERSLYHKQLQIACELTWTHPTSCFAVTTSNLPESPSQASGLLATRLRAYLC